MDFAPEVARSRARLISALLMLSFVICHLTAHAFLLVSIDAGNEALMLLLAPWLTPLGLTVLASAALVHYANALWSLYVRRWLRLSALEWWQLGLGLAASALLTKHVVATRFAYDLYGVGSDYNSVLLAHWVSVPWLGVVQVLAVLAVWSHACIGIYFWLRTKPWFPDWQPAFVLVGLLLPTLALAGYVSAGNQILRAAQDPAFVQTVMRNANLTDGARAAIDRMAVIGWSANLALVLLVFAARGVRYWRCKRRTPPVLTYPSGRRIMVFPGATVLETLRAAGLPHAAVCGGRARCTTCRVLVTRGFEALPDPEPLEAMALARIAATPEMRLACQLRPRADITVAPLLAADASAGDGRMRGGLEGRERLVAVMFVDLRGATTLAEGRLPYDVLFILNQFIQEMAKALFATRGHYSQFTGDGLMALYGLEAADPATGAADAIRGAREMLMRLEQLNHRLKDELAQPLRIGIGIHYSEAIVGAMGPPRSQIVTAIGDTVNTAARLESLTKEFNCPLILSRSAAEAAGLDLAGHTLHECAVKGRTGQVQFYALDAAPEMAGV
jgi:adenylate cyclase